MRESLWPGSPEEHLEEIDRYFSNGERGLVEVFVLERGNGELGGFIELNLRNWAEGSLSTQVPYIEGWYVDADLRGQGYGKGLVDAAERWAIEHGFDELASDTELENTESIATHKALGFEEVERLVCFIKKLE
jgi:aminoglycoside 6'-N-acetyltransferase I